MTTSTSTDDATDEPEPVGRVARLAALENLDDATCAELTIARRLGFSFDGASAPGTTWERLHSWERTIYVRGSREIARLERLELAADLAEHLPGLFASAISVSLVETIGPAFGITLVDAPTTDNPQRTAENESALERARRGDADALSGLEARAAALAGKIEERGGTVPTAADDAQAPTDARSRLGITVRKA